MTIAFTLHYHYTLGTGMVTYRVQKKGGGSMNIELMKQLEDLKIVSQELGAQLSEQIVNKKDQYLRTIKSDFINFFEEKGFTVNSSKNSVTATYGTLSACLSHEDPGTQYMGCYFALQLDLKSLNNKEYTIVLNRNEPGLNMSLSFSGADESDDSKLQKEIEDMRKSIEQSKQRLDGFSNETWELFIKNDSSNRNNLYSPSFKSMQELLSSLID